MFTNVVVEGQESLILEDMRSLSCSLKFYELVPSVWEGRESVIWRYGERYLERELCVDGEIEVFKLSRSYKELIERLELKKIDDIVDLPCEIQMDDYFDDTVVNDKNLPDVVIDIVNDYDDTNDMGICLLYTSRCV